MVNRLTRSKKSLRVPKLENNGYAPGFKVLSEMQKQRVRGGVGIDFFNRDFD